MRKWQTKDGSLAPRISQALVAASFKENRLIGTELKLCPPQSCYVLPPGLIVDFRISRLTGSS